MRWYIVTVLVYLSVARALQWYYRWACVPTAIVRNSNSMCVDTCIDVAIAGKVWRGRTHGVVHIYPAIVDFTASFVSTTDTAIEIARIDTKITDIVRGTSGVKDGIVRF